MCINTHISEDRFPEGLLLRGERYCYLYLFHSGNKIVSIKKVFNTPCSIEKDFILKG